MSRRDLSKENEKESQLSVGRGGFRGAFHGMPVSLGRRSGYLYHGGFGRWGFPWLFHGGYYYPWWFFIDPYYYRNGVPYVDPANNMNLGAPPAPPYSWGNVAPPPGYRAITPPPAGVGPEAHPPVVGYSQVPT